MTRWQWLITHEQALFKSATLYVGGIITALPDIANYLQANWSDVAHYIPAAWHDRSISLIGSIVLVARLRTLVKVPAETQRP